MKVYNYTILILMLILLGYVLLGQGERSYFGWQLEEGETEGL